MSTDDDGDVDFDAAFDDLFFSEPAPKAVVKTPERSILASNDEWRVPPVAAAPVAAPTLVADAGNPFASLPPAKPPMPPAIAEPTLAPPPPVQPTATAARYTTLPSVRDLPPGDAVTTVSVTDDGEHEWDHLVSQKGVLATVHEVDETKPRYVRKSLSSVPEQHKSLGESQRQALWHTLHANGSVAAMSIAPVKRVSLPTAHIVHEPRKGETLLHTIDLKLASFASYLGETKTLKAELEAAHLANAAYATKVAHLEESVAAHAANETQLRAYIQALESSVGAIQDSAAAMEASQSQLLQAQAHWTKQRRQLQTRALRRILDHATTSVLRRAFAHLVTAVRRRQARMGLATNKMAMILLAHAEKRHSMDRGLHCLRSSGQLQAGEHRAAMATTMVKEYRRHARETSLQCMLLLMEAHSTKWRMQTLDMSFRRWRAESHHVTVRNRHRRHALRRLDRWMQLRGLDSTRRALTTWRGATQGDVLQSAIATASAQVQELHEAKECVFALSRQKAKIEESTRQLEHRSAKHGFVAYVMRQIDRATGIRRWLLQWRAAATLSKATKWLDARVTTLEAALDDQTKFAKSLDQYNKVLLADVERYQFVTHDTRIAVEALSKKLLREEARVAEIEAANASLATHLTALCTVDAAWALPHSLVQLGKDLVVDRLTQLFGIHADAPTNDGWTPRMSLGSCYELVQSTLAPAGAVTDTLDVLAPLGSYFSAAPLTLPAFVNGLHDYLEAMRNEAADPALQAHLDGFWRHLLAPDENPEPSWARQNKLSDDILQNQEKLLAVLEHETAVVERAVLEKASLKHAYPSEAVPQIDLPPTDPSIAWYDLPQVGDLILAYERPLVALFVKYATHHLNSPTPAPAPHWRPLERQLQATLAATQPHAVAMHLQGALQCFQDLKLVPSAFTSEVVAEAFGVVTQHNEKVLTLPGFIQVFGACVLHSYAVCQTPMSVREKLQKAWYDVDWGRFQVGGRRQKPIYVGTDVETVLWPLFDYFATGGDAGDDGRISLTVAKFCRFLTEIAGLDKESCRTDGELMFRKAVRGSTAASRMVFDEFYLGIYYMHQLKDTTRRYESAGDALQEWMAQL
ncbi:hypothetical protein SPRG_03484 [Saprolegnia parasitica CBS 223.65]|uniref:EF-hand domain-containing protein n=1 Tax=Saprolegnia parasitica (strain CBS 223.65) TaxID=695850 RepID=A0A067CQN6_SAPPC|nr:hypothetical protein SPRG_03484 [Saprolegnia parasitica CBS 223.65]KDO31555.1 hypothetical protein SPRG_03484 [Saprolegnia parasitica CBS 223.65]|eukprot:XP_012197462.1 hypothetical protein SPRG_03484 [Saprolegnia parasitica CBS 223.65]